MFKSMHIFYITKVFLNNVAIHVYSTITLTAVGKYALADKQRFCFCRKFW